MRNMSFSMTTPQFVAGEKDVTRRFGWWKLKAGDQVMAVEKAMGLKKGEKIKTLGVIEIVSVGPEQMRAMIDNLEYGHDEMRREGYPFGLTCPRKFVEKLCFHSKKRPHDVVNRIEFRKVQNEQ